MENLNKENCKILMVDDAYQNIQILGRLLRSEGYLLSFSLSGEKALEMVESEPFDLILLDIMMPGISGYDVCEEIKKKPAFKDTPVIFISASTELKSIVKGFKLGAVDYITKPFQPDELLARVQTHLELKFMREQLIQTIATKDKIFSIIAHDIKNPLGAIFSTCDLLIDQFNIFDMTKILSFIKNIKISVVNLTKLLENLLDWARAQSGNLKNRPESIQLSQIIQDTFLLLDQQAKPKRIQLLSTVDDSITIYIDSNIISTVLRNIISNAIKYTPHEGQITVQSKTIDQHEEICISDTGTGITPERIKTLFQITETSMPGTDGETGTGLGLVICKEFIEKSNGRIWVESEVGKGSHFKFTVPREMGAGKMDEKGVTS
ncbi:MAG: Response regulator receiver sensor signal transduction histidine kinase [Candidatus Magnetoglobus multicellularis str. Araruama]|uniref:histidine kinase n=1 Tax=Candidatus Magnetoglobus multicellularis str. Araruama TaxID=890399 RepID=A0A1V1PGS6_9BACT|nr:MAG: Response regulator receiver sensor signal transduction histidine kinase [Candidatus Magnetoglobus multicellularis str. Araruama]